MLEDHCGVHCTIYRNTAVIIKRKIPVYYILVHHSDTNVKGECNPTPMTRPTNWFTRLIIKHVHIHSPAKTSDDRSWSRQEEVKRE